MALKVVEFQCKSCGEQQEQFIKNSENKAEQDCKNCKAKPKDLELVFGNPKHGQHVSWSKWRMM